MPNKFVVKKVTRLEHLATGLENEIPESDLSLQTDNHLIQLKFVPDEGAVQKFKVEPGFQIFTPSNRGLITNKIEFKHRDLLEDISSTQSIFKEAKTFFNKLDVYDKLQRPKKRGILLYSAPGCGKSSSIEKFCCDFAAEDPGTVVLVWPTSRVDADSVIEFFGSNSEYAPSCTRVVIVVEDIGGGEAGDNRGVTSVDSGLLNLLDGIGLTFRLPTFIIATTNHPETLLSSLADRPGRFDRLIKLSPPSHDEKIRLLTFLSKRELSDEEKECIGRKGTENFSIAHLEEIAIRSLLHDKTYAEVVQEMIDHNKLFRKNFEERESMGF